MSLSVDGITIPDSQLAREITDLVRDGFVRKGYCRSVALCFDL